MAPNPTWKLFNAEIRKIQVALLCFVYRMRMKTAALSHACVWYLQDYLKAAVDYFEDETTARGVDDINAIWVASDDPGIVDEVRTLAPVYFPSVPSEAIVYVASGVAGGSSTRGVDTVTRSQVCSKALCSVAHCRYITSSHIKMYSNSPAPRLAVNT